MTNLIIGATLYDPTNIVLTVANLEAIIAAAVAGVEDIAVKIAPNKFAINARQTVYTDAIAISEVRAIFSKPASHR